VAQSAGAYRAAGALFNGHEGKDFKEFSSLLGYTGMFSRKSGGLSGVGIQWGRAMLVHQWDNLSGRGAKKLARKDKDMPTR
jgi:hypothetical protein